MEHNWLDANHPGAFVGLHTAARSHDHETTPLYAALDTLEPGAPIPICSRGLRVQCNTPGTTPSARSVYETRDHVPHPAKTSLPFDQWSGGYRQIFWEAATPTDRSVMARERDLAVTSKKHTFSACDAFWGFLSIGDPNRGAEIARKRKTDQGSHPVILRPSRHDQYSLDRSPSRGIPSTKPLGYDASIWTVVLNW